MLGVSPPQPAATDHQPPELRRCSCCLVRRPLWAFSVISGGRGRGKQTNSVCRACKSGSKTTKLQQRKASGLPLDEVQQLANSKIDRLRARDQRGAFDMAKHQPEQPPLIAPVRDCQAQVKTSYHKPTSHKPTSKSDVSTNLDDYVAKRQVRYEADMSKPEPETRQTRRARERRTVKDANTAIRRLMTPDEILKASIDRAVGARARSRGGVSTTTKRRQRVTHDLPPAAIRDMLERQRWRCALTGERFQTSERSDRQNIYGPSPNRINSGGDYVVSNVELVCWWVNRLIGDMPRNEAIEFLRERKLLRKDFGQLELI